MKSHRLLNNTVKCLGSKGRGEGLNNCSWRSKARWRQRKRASARAGRKRLLVTVCVGPHYINYECLLKDVQEYTWSSQGSFPWRICTPSQYLSPFSVWTVSFMMAWYRVPPESSMELGTWWVFSKYQLNKWRPYHLYEISGQQP